MWKYGALLLVFVFVFSSFVFLDSPVSAASEDSWATKASMNQARFGLGVVVVNEKIYAIGGCEHTGYPDMGDMSNSIACVGTTEEYDSTRDLWTFKTPMPTARYHFGISTYQGKIYCIGGGLVNGSKTGVNEVYDPATDTWEQKTPIPNADMWLHANTIDNLIYFIGGATNMTWAYNPTTDLWTTRDPMPIPVYAFTGRFTTSVVLDDKIHVLGWTIPSGNFHLIYDPKTDSWSSATPCPSSGYTYSGATTGIMASKRIYLFNSGVGYWVMDIPHISTWVYIPENDSWINGQFMTTQRISAGVGVINDLLYVIGGSTPSINMNSIASAANEQYIPIGYGKVSPTPSPAGTLVSDFATITIAVASATSAVAVCAGVIVYFKKHKR
jgi:hypothetical protein